MVIDPDHFLAAAKEVYNGDPVGHQETGTRVAMGRAYYSAYLSVRRAVRRARSSPGLRLDHQNLADALETPSEPQHVQDIGARLNGLRSNRNRADYDLRSSLTRMDAGLAIHTAQQVVDTAPRCASDLDKAVRRNYSA